MLHRPSECEDCLRLHRLTVRKILSDEAFLLPREQIHVLSWCCICGLPVLLEIDGEYEFAKKRFFDLHHTPRTHKGLHAEAGGWGVHWRLDEVLAAAFPREHILPAWHRRDTYEHSQSMEMAVRVLHSKEEIAVFARSQVDVERRMMDKWINSHSRSREELIEYLTETLSIEPEVWDHAQVAERFEILDFVSPFAVAIDKVTGERGSLMFQKSPRLYFGFDAGRVV